MRTVALYGVTLFFSAFLLFLVQPLLGKYILPWFGGTPAVWTTCMLFFQVLLLGGYSYAHLLASRLSARKQALLHVGLLAGSVLTLPILPSSAWKPAAGHFPAPQILILLTVCVGAPYFMLASASPLLQSWFSRIRPGDSPYRLYSLSNLGSLLAIVSYPFLIEPALALAQQARIWSWSYVAFAVACGLCALPLHGRKRAAQPQTDSLQKPLDSTPGSDCPAHRRALWLLLPACSSVLLLATTNQL
jgi:hypothetical protein